MDDQYREMVRFCQELIEFNQQLKSSLNDLRQHHDAVSPHWQDEMRRAYDREWEPLKQNMEQYISWDAQVYVESLSIQMAHLERYLRG
jgi:uncharacterized protein YukE